MSTRPDNQQALSSHRAPNTSLSGADRRKLQDLDLALVKAKHKLEVFCMETNQASSLLAIEASPEEGVQDDHVPEYIPDDCCQQCGNSYELDPVAEFEHQKLIPPGVSCVIARVLNATPQLQTRYTDTATGGSNDGEWYVASPEGRFMGAQTSGSIELLADRVREDWGFKRIFSMCGGRPEDFNCVLSDHNQMRQIYNSSYNVGTDEPAL